MYLFLVLFNCNGLANEVKNSKTGFIDLNIYPVLSDVDNDSVFTVNIFSKLPQRFSYFSLTNIFNQSEKSELSDTVSYYTEQNLRWQISEDSPLDLTVQYNMRTGDDNDRLRLGFRWRLNNTSFLKEAFNAMNLSYSINFHVIQYDDSNEDIRQMEHVFRMKFPYLTDRLYLAGFIDHTFHEKSSTTRPKNPIIGKAQLGFRLIENLYATVEYRVNQYRRSDVNNVAYGVQYLIKW